MGLFGKRAAAGSGSAGADAEAVEESRASVTGWDAREPAPAGSLHRPRAREEAPGYRLHDAPGDVPAPRTIRWGSIVPGSKWGRIAAGVGAFVVLGSAAAVVLGVRSFLLHDDRFVVTASSEIQASGNVHLTRAQVLSVFGEDVERNIFKVPLAERRADLERLPWVQHATVMRLLPNRLRISIVERVPVAFVRQGTAIGLVDAAGVLLDMPEDTAGDPKYSFPVLSGLNGSDPASTRAARMEIYREFVKQLDGAGAKISDSLSEVDVSDPEDVKALIPSGGTDVLVHFGDQDFLERYKHFEDHLPEWKQQYPKLASADMRYERQVVLEMQPGAGVPVNDAAGAPVASPDASANAIANATAGSSAALRNDKNNGDDKVSGDDKSGIRKVAAVEAAKTAAPRTTSHTASNPVAKGNQAGHLVTQKVSAPAGVSASNAKMYAALAAARKQPATPAGRAQP